MTHPTPLTKADRIIRANTRLGRGTLLALIFGLGGWAALTSLQGAVIAPAEVIVKAGAKTVQHLEGGIVAKIHVEEGELVASGSPLIDLETTRDSANLKALDANLNTLLAEKARLIAERDHSSTIAFPARLMDAAETTPAIRQIITDQQNLRAARQASLDGERAQLAERITQLHEVKTGLNAQITAKTRQLALIETELSSLQELHKKGLVPQTRLLALTREQARLEGEKGQLISTTARTGVQISETKLEILQIEKQHLATTLGELRSITTRANELQEKRTALQDKLTRMSLRAPRTGIVHKLSVHTIGGVVHPGHPLLTIIPRQAKLIFAARINPADIDHIRRGQPARIRINSQTMRNEQELNGTITMVAADAVRDKPEFAPYFRVFVELPQDQSAQPLQPRLIPGMSAEIFFETKSRPVVSYLLQPITDQLRRAMREP